MRELHWFLPRYVLFLMVTIMQGSCFVVMFLRFSCAYIISVCVCVCVGGWVGVGCVLHWLVQLYRCYIIGTGANICGLSLNMKGVKNLFLFAVN